MSIINVFLSSSMSGELDSERESVKSNFDNNPILQHFFYLIHIEKHAQAKKIQKAYKDEVKQSRIMILLLNKELRDAVNDEFQTAIDNNIKILCYVKAANRRNKKLKAFIDNLTNHPVTYLEFHKSTDLVSKIIEDIKKEILSTYLSANPVNEEPIVVSLPNSNKNTYRYFGINEILKTANDPKISKMTVDDLMSYSMALLFEQGKLKDALMLLEIAITKDSNNWMIYNNIGYILEEMGQSDAAIYNYNKSISIHPSEMAYYNIGLIFYRKHDFEEALVYFNKSLELNPNKQSALENAVNCFFKLNKFEEALVYAEKSFNIGENELAIGNYAVALATNNKFEKAFQILNKLDENSSLYHRIKSIIFRQSENFSDSIKEVDIVIEKGDVDYDLSTMKLFCLIKVKDYQKALEWFEYIENNFPIDSNDYNYMGYTILTEMNESTLSIPFFEKSISKNKLNLNAWVNLQYCYLQLKEYEKSIEICDKTLAIFPFDTKAIHNKSQAFMYLGKTEDALKLRFFKNQELTNNNFTKEELESQYKENMSKLFGFDESKKETFFDLINNLFKLSNKINE